MAERRVRTFKRCAVPDCDWELVTSWFVGGPDTVEHVTAAQQEHAAGLHMRKHWTPERTHLT